MSSLCQPLRQASRRLFPVYPIHGPQQASLLRSCPHKWLKNLEWQDMMYWCFQERYKGFQPLFLVLAITLKNSGVRLIYLVPPLASSSGLISIRYVYLRLNLQNNFTEENARMAFYAAIAIAVIAGQLATALHYWALSPIGYGLALLGPSYGLTNFVGNLTDGRSVRHAAIEPALIWLGIWMIAIWSQG